MSHITLVLASADVILCGTFGPRLSSNRCVHSFIYLFFPLLRVVTVLLSLTVLVTWKKSYYCNTLLSIALLSQHCSEQYLTFTSFTLKQSISNSPFFPWHPCAPNYFSFTQGTSCIIDYVCFSSPKRKSAPNCISWGLPYIKIKVRMYSQ